jgi:hypothetical protein
MNDAHLHLLVNHVPIIGGAFTSLLLAWGILRKQAAMVNFALALFIALGAVSFVAHSTGEDAEEIVEHTVSEEAHRMIHEHEEAAFPAHLAMVATALASIVTLSVRKLREGRLMPIVVLLLSLVTFGLMARAGNLGGRVSHVAAFDPNAGGEEHHEEGEHHEGGESH